MNAVAQRQDNPSEQLRQQLTRMGSEFKNALPSHISPEKFQRVVMTVVTMTPELLGAERKSLLGACMKCAADGLVPDGREAALVVFSGKAQYMPMVAGLMKRARNSGEISTISAHVIYERDDFVVQLGDDEGIKHVPAWGDDRGNMIGAYAIAKLKDGGIQRALMSKAEIEKIRQASRSKGSPLWTQWTEEAWKKTVLRRLTKLLPMDAETDRMERLLQRDDEAPTAIEGHAELVTQASAPSKLDALADLSGGETITADGEVLQGDVEQPGELALGDTKLADLLRSITACGTAEAVDATLKAQSGSIKDADRETLMDAVNDRKRELAKKGGGR